MKCAAHNGLFHRIAQDNALNENAYKTNEIKGEKWVDVFAHCRNLIHNGRIPPLCRSLLTRHQNLLSSLDFISSIFSCIFFNQNNIILSYFYYYVVFYHFIVKKLK